MKYYNTRPLSEQLEEIKSLPVIGIEDLPTHYDVLVEEEDWLVIATKLGERGEQRYLFFN